MALLSSASSFSPPSVPCTAAFLHSFPPSPSLPNSISKARLLSSPNRIPNDDDFRPSAVHAHASQRVEFSSPFNDGGDDDYEEEEVNFEGIPSLPPSKGCLEIVINNDIIQRLDLSPAHAILRGYACQISDGDAHSSEPMKDPKVLLQKMIRFVINYEREDPNDMRELSEIPEIRLWFVRLDGAYPWLPIVLDWRGGELARYAAMLVPHEMSRKTGIVFNPEALELFAMNKLFTVYSWLESIDVSKADARVGDMLRILGFKVEEELFVILRT